ncbi:T9SS type A sorting domain-containing protein [Apibacter muscae]|uniref:T9SS type A sorting domain-containing protein n=1 Tax=Apibacter muscae TaxID=2509004 RepID=UPI0011AC6473|nr:T9SS type A sorting domain-containing protein [Apibacter muscae]TWP23167.1 T9SS type A sorting domain-containing protein [Apibacter muscae]
MIKNLLFYTLTLLAPFTNMVYAQKYHEDDKEGLRQFLRQEETIGRDKIYNLKSAGLTVSDTLNWYTSEGWINKLSNISLEFYGTDSRIISIILKNESFIGNLNCEKFSQLEELDISPLSNYYNYGIASLNVKDNKYLTSLKCDYNKLSTLDLSNNNYLKFLSCNSNQINTLILPNSSDLKRIYCNSNQINTLNVKYNPKLEILDCSRNQLTTLDVTNNPELTQLNCSFNQTLNNLLIKNPKMTVLYCSNNEKLTSLDLKECISLRSLYAGSNHFTELNIKDCVELVDLDIRGNTLTSLDLSKNTKLESLDALNGLLKSIDFSNNPVLNWYILSGNQLRFSTIKPFGVWPGDQAITKGKTVSCSDIIDLSSEYKFNNSITSYTWYDKIDPYNPIVVYLLDMGNGKFVAGEANKGKTLICKMTNAAFPGFTAQYEVRISNQGGELPSLPVSQYKEEDKDGLRNFLRQEGYSSTGNKVYNFEIAGLATSDTLTWNGSEEWLNKLSNISISFSGINKRITGLVINSKSVSLGEFSGILNCNNFTELISLKINNNKIKGLNVKNNAKLEELSAVNGLLEFIDLSSNSQLSKLILSNNKLRFSTILLGSKPANFITTLAPQAVIEGEAVDYSDEIDISTEYNINGSISTYIWYDDLGNTISVSSLGNGKFVAGKANKGKNLICKITNTAFPNLTLEYAVKINETDELPSEGVSSLIDHLKLNSGIPNLYQLNSEKIFQVYAKADNNQENIKIGLFDNYSNLIARIDLSQNQKHVFSCLIPSRVSSGNYIIQAYTEKLNETTLVERASNSSIIDALPVNIKSEGIWSRGMSTAPDNEIYKNMQIKTAVNYLHETTVNEAFKVYSPSSNGEVKIGLFDLNGNFIERIDQSKVNATTYNTTISDRVYEGEYLIIPYIESGKVKQIVERNTSTRIDRLPIYVIEEDIWGRSISSKSTINKENEAEISLYPNPVMDVLTINSLAIIDLITVYDYSGKEIKSISKIQNNQINLHDLIPGNYVLSIKTNEGTIIKKIIKK